MFLFDSAYKIPKYRRSRGLVFFLGGWREKDRRSTVRVRAQTGRGLQWDSRLDFGGLILFFLCSTNKCTLYYWSCAESESMSIMF